MANSAKKRNDRVTEHRHLKQHIFGDFAYADDTAIAGEVEETFVAETIFDKTITAFGGALNRHKTEGLRVTSEATAAFNIPHLGEAQTVKHVGALLGVRGNHVSETQARITKALRKVGWVAGAWTKGRGAHINKHRIKYSVRIRVMKSVLKGSHFKFL